MQLEPTDHLIFTLVIIQDCFLTGNYVESQPTETQTIKHTPLSR